MTQVPEYRVRPVRRFIVTRYEEQISADGKSSGGCDNFGEFENELLANQAAKAFSGYESSLGIPNACIGIFHVAKCPYENMPIRWHGDCTCPQSTALPSST